jgi:uncharacterized protein YjbJ (UPF0337 family)
MKKGFYKSNGTRIALNPLSASLQCLDALSEEKTMSRGTGDKVKGRMEKAAGDLLDDDRLRNRGIVDETVGKMKDGMERGLNTVKDAVTGRRPIKPPR